MCSNDYKCAKEGGRPDVQEPHPRKQENTATVLRVKLRGRRVLEDVHICLCVRFCGDAGWVLKA